MSGPGVAQRESLNPARLNRARSAPGKAADHTLRVWILRLHQPSMAASAHICILSKLQAQCKALIPAGCRLLHTCGFWQKAEWDEQTSEHAAQIWMLGAALSNVLGHHLSISACKLRMIRPAGGTAVTSVWIKYSKHSDCLVNISRTRDSCCTFLGLWIVWMGVHACRRKGWERASHQAQREYPSCSFLHQ
jgi:hypothetical protein